MIQNILSTLFEAALPVLIFNRLLDAHHCIRGCQP